MQTTIQTLFKRGYSKARISRELGISPKTVRKVLRSLENGEGELQKQPHPSSLDKHQEFIEIQRSKGLTRQRIYQDLVDSQGLCRQLQYGSRFCQQAGKANTQGLHGHERLAR